MRLTLFVTTALVSFATAGACRAIAVRHTLLDRPNRRSAHAVPKPRLGGVGLLVAFFGAATVLYARGLLGRHAVAPLGATAAIGILGLLDDLRPLSARVRVSVQIAAATVVVALRFPALPQAAGTLGAVVPAWILAPAAVLWIVWLTNLYNFMDGIDGMAGGQSLIAGLAIAGAASTCHAPTAALLGLALGGASLGFLFLNFPPSSIFMGDVGSTAIGFFLACVPFLGDPSPVSVEVVAVALGLFILDASVTLSRRVARGERWYEAHRSHYYQRPLAYGITHRAIALAAYLAFLIAGALAWLMAARAISIRVAGPATLGVFGVAVSAVRHVERTRRQAVSPNEANEAGAGRPAA
jgi:UDP-N-acetylmuramyl pentapeptide phosphotransferase/UDP-N-acetylglucosamine-1-phosphate transferase